MNQILAAHGIKRGYKVLQHCIGMFALLVMVSTSFPAVSINAQETIDFTGHWELQDGGDISSLGSGLGNRFSIWQDREKLILEWPAKERNEFQESQRFTFLFGTEPSVNRIRYGRGQLTMTTLVERKRTELVLTSIYRYSNRPDECKVTHKFSLTKPSQPAWSPDLRILTTRSISGMKPHQTTVNYRRK